jgi:hypothetical protein
MSDTPALNRRRFCDAAAATIAAGPLGLLGLSRRLEAMTETLTEFPRPTGSEKGAPRPFRVKFSDAELADLRRASRRRSGQIGKR